MAPTLAPASKLLSLTLLLVVSCVPGMCQGIENYAVVHTFGLPSATNARAFGMGGQVSCIWDYGSGNPAFAATHSKPNAGLRVSTTNFDHGPDIIAEHAHLVWPLKDPDEAVQVTLFKLDSEASPIALSPSATAAVDIAEDDLSVHYSRRLSDALTVGIGMSPYSQIKFSLAAPNGLRLMDVEVEPDWGARLGVAYEWAPGGFVGVVYDYYQETAEATGVAVGGSAHRVFNSDLLALGVSGWVRDDLLLAAEYQTASTSDGSLSNSLNGWHLGAEYRARPDCAMRAGVNDEHLSLGVGYQGRRWQVDYTYVNRWNDDVASDLFGASDTHQLQAIYRW